MPEPQRQRHRHSRRSESRAELRLFDLTDYFVTSRRHRLPAHLQMMLHEAVERSFNNAQSLNNSQAEVAPMDSAGSQMSSDDAGSYEQESVLRNIFSQAIATDFGVFT